MTTKTIMKPTVVAFFLAACVTSAIAEVSPQFIEFAVQQARDRGFTQCDSAVRNIFQSAGGKDIRVWTHTMKSTEKDQIQMAGAYGDVGDTITVEANIRRVGATCVVEVATTLVAEQSCPSYLSDNPVWKVESFTGDITQVKNSGGITAFLRPVGRSCVVTFRRAAETKVS